MYVEFSGAMGRRTGQDYITILDAKGAERPGALLPLDTDLWNGDLQRALSVVRGDTALPGEIRVEHGETEWRFVPLEPWAAGDYAVSVLPVLEDPAGNRIGHAFEELAPGDDTSRAPARVPFTIR